MTDRIDQYLGGARADVAFALAEGIPRLSARGHLRGATTMTRTIATAVLLGLSLPILLIYATAAAPAEVASEQISQAPDQPTVLPALYASYVALQAGAQRQFDQAAGYLVQLYSDMEGPQVRH